MGGYLANGVVNSLACFPLLSTKAASLPILLAEQGDKSGAPDKCPGQIHAPHLGLVTGAFLCRRSNLLSRVSREPGRPAGEQIPGLYDRVAAQRRQIQGHERRQKLIETCSCFLS